MTYKDTYYPNGTVTLFQNQYTEHLYNINIIIPIENYIRIIFEFVQIRQRREKEMESDVRLYHDTGQSSFIMEIKDGSKVPKYLNIDWNTLTVVFRTGVEYFGSHVLQSLFPSLDTLPTVFVAWYNSIPINTIHRPNQTSKIHSNKTLEINDNHCLSVATGKICIFDYSTNDGKPISWADANKFCMKMSMLLPSLPYDVVAKWTHQWLLSKIDRLSERILYIGKIFRRYV